MKKVIVDVDDVLALNTFINSLNNFLHSNYTYNDINRYYVEEMLDENQLIEFRKYIKENNIYQFSLVAPNSKEVLMKLMVEGYEIYPTSKFYSELDNIILPETLTYKCEFLQKNYPFIPTKNYIFINNKLLLNADIRIDDSLDNLSDNGLNLLYSAYHNRKIENRLLSDKKILRVQNWKDIENKVLKKRKLIKIDLEKRKIK